MPPTPSPELILASQSPRRHALLSALGVPFVAAAADVNECALPGEEPAAMARRLAEAKASATAERFPGRAVLALDTVVALEGVALGKPRDAAEAEAMLRSLRGRAHTVLSAVFTLNPATGRQAAAVSESQVWMRAYSDAEIAAYVASGDPMDKAGAYAIQNAQFAPVERIDGCFAGVMGFPLGEVAQVLAAVGIEVPRDIAPLCRPFSGRCCQESSGRRLGTPAPGETASRTS